MSAGKLLLQAAQEACPSDRWPPATGHDRAATLGIPPAATFDEIGRLLAPSHRRSAISCWAGTMTDMAANRSEAAQKTNLAEGLAAAALVLGVEGITSQRFSLDRAFEHAWTSWRHKGKFPQMRVGLERNDIVSVLDRSKGRRGAYTAYWDTELPAKHFTPQLRDRDDDPTDALRFIEEQTDIPADDWVDLTRSFVDQLATWDEEYVLRGGGNAS